LSYAKKHAEKRSQDTKSTPSANVHEGHHGQESSEEESSEEEANQELEANVTKGMQGANKTKGKAHPGDIRRVLRGNKKSNKKTCSANNIMWNIHTMHSFPRARDGMTPGETKLLPPLDDDEGSSSDDGSVFDPSKILEEYWGDQEDPFFP
jgi:hypothetical protein